MKREKSQLKNKLSKKITKVEKTILSVESDFDKILVKYNPFILVGLILLIGIVAFQKFLSVDFLFFFKDIGSDTINQNYPSQIQAYNLLREGFTSKWSFYSGMGRTFLINLPVEPLSWLQLLENRIGMSIIGADYMIYSKFIHLFVYNFLLTGVLFYFYLRTISIWHYSALVGAIAITFSGYMVLGSSWGFSGHIFKAVFLLFAFEQLYIKKRRYFFPLAVLLLSNNPFVLYLYSFFLLLYSIFRYLQNNNSLVNYLKLAANMILLGIVGILMNLVNAFNAFYTMFNSPRVAGNASYSQILSSGEEIYSYGSHWATLLLRFFSNDILGTGSHFKGWNNYLEAPIFYIGLFVVLIFPQVFIYLNKRNKIIFGSFLLFWLLTLLIPFFRKAILAFTGDYYRYGFDFFIPFTLLFYAIYALNELDKTLVINYKLLGITLLTLLIFLFFPYQSIQLSAIDNSLRLKIVFLLFAYAGLLIFLSKPKYRGYAQIGLLLLIFTEFSFLSYKSYQKRIPITKKEFRFDKAGYADGTPEAVKYLKNTDKSLFYRIEKDYSSGSAEHTSLNDAPAQGYYGTSRYSSFSQLNYIRFLEETNIIEKGNEIATRWNQGLRGYPLLQTFGNIKYHFSKSEDPLFKKFGFDSIATIDSVKILKNRYYLPFGYTYDRFITFEDYQKLSPFNKQIALLNGFVYEDDEFCHYNTDGFNRLNIKDSLTFVDESHFSFPLYQNFTDSLKKDTFAISSFKQDNIKGTITLSKPKLLFFTIPFNKGWRVNVNGKRQQLSRVNIGFTGILLPTGTHKLELYFVPEYYQLTSWVSWVSVSLFWLYLGYYLVQKRKRRKI